MSLDSQIAKADKADEQNEVIEERIQKYRLSKEEASAYRYYCGSSQTPLAPEVQERLFRVFMNGSSCEEIFRMNGKKYPLGAIIAARIDSGWDEVVQNTSRKLIEQTASKVALANTQAVDMLANLVMAATQTNNAKIMAYLQSGDPDDLGDIRIDSLKTYLQAIEQLAKLSGSKGEPPKPAGVFIQTGATVISQTEQPGELTTSDLLRLLQGKK